MNNNDPRLPFLVGEQIKAARLDRHMTQEELASRIGISRAQLGQWESQNRNPRMRNFKKIAEALNIDSEELLYYGIDMEKAERKHHEEEKADPCGYRINALNLLLRGLSPAGLDKVLEATINIIQEGGCYLLPNDEDDE